MDHDILMAFFFFFCQRVGYINFLVRGPELWSCQCHAHLPWAHTLPPLLTGFRTL